MLSQSVSARNSFAANLRTFVPTKYFEKSAGRRSAGLRAVLLLLVHCSRPTLMNSPTMHFLGSGRLTTIVQLQC